MKRDGSFNQGLTAQPKSRVSEEEITPFDTEHANIKTAQESGYTDKKGHAKGMAKTDVLGHPTGAYTDVGAGRSSVVKPKP
jgi:hypothetical protein